MIKYYYNANASSVETVVKIPLDEEHDEEKSNLDLHVFSSSPNVPSDIPIETPVPDYITVAQSMQDTTIYQGILHTHNNQHINSEIDDDNSDSN